MKRDLIVATLADGLDVDVGVVRNAIARVHGHAPAGPHRPAQQQHPHAPGGDPGAPAARPSQPLTAPPHEEVEVISLLADHPALIATAEADKAFWLLTDARLRDMYSAARAGQSLLELAATSGQLPSPTAVHVLSGKYADSKDPTVELLAMTRNLEVRKSGAGLAELKTRLADATRRGDRDLARQLAQLAEAERKGDRELVARLREALEAETSSNGKQVD